MVIPLERRVTPLGAGKAAARTGFASQARLTSLRALRMITDMRRSSRVAERACDRKMRLVGIDEIGSSYTGDRKWKKQW